MMRDAASAFSRHKRVTVRVVDSIPSDARIREIVELAGAGLHRIERDDAGALSAVRLTRNEHAEMVNVEALGCLTCRAGTPVGHFGSAFCDSGAIRAGGWRSHCTCDVCF